ncbi:MAG: 3-hydroxyacyl-ACP dehydratase FabZ [Magnetospiraceae bacterium]
MTEPRDMSLDDVLRMLPHRYPFLLVDKVNQVVPGETGYGIKNVTVNEPFFPGHFPGNPVMPGVLIIEAMAQTAAVVVISSLEDDGSPRQVFFMGIDGAKFRRPVIPGDQLEIYVEKERTRRDVWRFKGIARVDGTVVAEAMCTAMVRSGA